VVLSKNILEYFSLSPSNFNILSSLISSLNLKLNYELQNSTWWALVLRIYIYIYIHTHTRKTIYIYIYILQSDHRIVVKVRKCFPLCVWYSLSKFMEYFRQLCLNYNIFVLTNFILKFSNYFTNTKYLPVGLYVHVSVIYFNSLGPTLIPSGFCKRP
jgi:hypothetical protein